LRCDPARRVIGRQRREDVGRPGGREAGRQGGREPGNQGAREPGNQGAREPGSAGGKEGKGREVKGRELKGMERNEANHYFLEISIWNNGPRPSGIHANMSKDPRITIVTILARIALLVLTSYARNT
jgi:hypothetical protein